VGLTAGASAPEILVEEVVDFLAGQGFTDMREVEVMPEHVRFGLPPEIVEAIGVAPAVAGSPARAGFARDGVQVAE
jgi:4-hydroxy-3-methylbut-2-enyl diphosphate reductase